MIKTQQAIWRTFVNILLKSLWSPIQDTLLNQNFEYKSAIQKFSIHFRTRSQNKKDLLAEKMFLRGLFKIICNYRLFQLLHSPTFGFKKKYQMLD